MRHVLALSLPSVITTSSRGLMDVADFWMLGRLGSKEVLAAILPAQMLMWTYTVIGFGIVMMVNTFVAQALGRREHRECSAYAWQSVYLSIGFGAVALLPIPWLPRIIAWIGHDAVIQAEELRYLRIAAWTVMPTIAAEGIAAFFTGIHKPAVAMWTALESNVLNIAACWVLIFGCFGFPRMGIAGAATGTLIAVCYRMVRLGLTLWSKPIAGAYASRETWRLSWPRLGKLVRVGSPFGIQACAEVTVWATFVNVLIGRFFDAPHLIANNAAWQYLRIAFMPCNGVGRAVSALVGKAIGAGDYARAFRETRLATMITLVYMISLAAVYVVFRRRLIAEFNDDPAVIAIGSRIMICAAVFQIFDAIGITYSGALRGAGDTLVPSIFFIVSHWLIIVGGGWFVASTFPAWGSLGPWMVASFLIIVASLFLMWRWHGGAWKKIRLFADEPRDRIDAAPASSSTAIEA